MYVCVCHSLFSTTVHPVAFALAGRIKGVQHRSGKLFRRAILEKKLRPARSEQIRSECFILALRWWYRSEWTMESIE